jgi:nitroimidazol reductase NimA-like FMN-containing flavoprotein (pyridoxamine 5'-phosphate oxidase superfamily)
LQAAPPRSAIERRSDTVELLESAYQLWLSTSGPESGPHLIPVAFVWNGSWITMATFVESRTAANLRDDPRTRLAVGSTADVVILDGDVSFVAVDEMDTETADRFAAVSHDPRVMPGLVYLRFTPRRIQAWNGFHEFDGRTVMAGGNWRA